MENLVSQGFEIAIFGMGTVFMFLTLLILATHGMSLLVQKYEAKNYDQLGFSTSYVQFDTDFYGSTTSLLIRPNEPFDTDYDVKTFQSNFPSNI